MKHQISVHSDIPHINTPALTAHIKRCIRGALEQEGVTVPCEINVLTHRQPGHPGDQPGPERCGSGDRRAVVPNV